MASIKISTFDTEQAAKNFFAEVVESAELHGAFVGEAGKVFLQGQADPIVATKKWVVLVTAAEVTSDT